VSSPSCKKGQTGGLIPPGGGGGNDSPSPTPSSPVNIPDEPVPMANIPDMEVPLAEIFDEEVPLANLPKTGDQGRSALWAMLCLVSLGAIAALMSQKEQEER
jgi:LPXTG-motif cell wall-anchored protein